VLETRKIKLEKRWLCSAKVCSVWVHRTVRWCTRQCPVRQAGSGELAALGSSTALYGYKSPDCPVCTGLSGEPFTGEVVALGKELTTYDYNSPDCPVCTGLSGEPTVSRGNGRPSQGSHWGTGLSGVHRTVSGAPMALKIQRSASPNKEGYPHRTVSGAPCDRRQDQPSWNALNGS
jgi:hypothetical protein